MSSQKMTQEMSSALWPTALLASMCLLLVVGCARSATVAVPDRSAEATAELDADRPELENSMLWRVTGNGLADTSYLFGTIHMITRDRFVIKDRVAAAFENCAHTAFELDLTDWSAALKMLAMLRLPDTVSLSDYSSPSRMDSITSWIEDTLSADPTAYLKQKPLALLSVIIQREIGDEIPASYDMYFCQLASGSGKSVHGLETVEDQMAVFDQIPLSEQIDWLIEAMYPPEVQPYDLDALMDAYAEENLSEVASMLLEESPEMEKYGSLFLDDRNHNWLPQLDSLVRLGSCFVAVGAGHLPGESGLINLMRDAGFEVLPVLGE